MPSGDIHLDITGENKDLIRKLIQSEKRVDRLEARLRQSGKSGQKSFGGVSDQLKNVATALVGPIGVGVAVTKLVGSVKNAYRTMLEEHRRFMGNIETTADAKNRFLYNAVNLDKEEGEKLGEAVARDSGAPLHRVYDILATAVSAAGDADADTLRSAATQAAIMERRGLGEGGELVGSALDLVNITGQSDSRANFAFLRQIGASSRAVSLQAQQNLIPALTASRLAGDAPEQAAELTAAINAAMKDAEGSRTATGVTNLVGRLKQLELAPGADGKWRKLAGETTTERIADLQRIFGSSDEKTQDAILKKIGGRAAIKPIVEMIARNTSEWQAILTDKQQKIEAPGSASAMDAFSVFDTSTTEGSEGIVSAKRAAEAAVEQDATLGRDEEAASIAARDVAMQWVKQQGAQGALMWGVGKALYGWNEGLAPEHYRNLAANVTPEERKDTDAYREFMANMDKLINAATNEEMRKAYEKLNTAAESLERTAEKLGSPASTNRQELD